MFNALNETFNKVDPSFKSSAVFTSVEGLAGAVANAMIGAGISLGIIGLAVGFIQFSTSLGDPKKMVNAKYAVLLSGVAFLVSTLGWAIKGALFKTVGL